jgi:DNA-binding transcriptional regulator YiaG
MSFPSDANLAQTPAVALKSNFHCDIRASFATAFRNWRLENKIPLKKIATDLGVSIATVNTWEAGRRFPTGRHFEVLADYTGLPPCRLFCVMADKCVPAECQLALPKKKP